MRLITNTFFVCAIAFACVGCATHQAVPVNVDAMIDDLRSDDGEYSDAERAADILTVMGVAAFPHLAAHSRDRRTAHNLGWSCGDVTIGLVCTKIVQGQIELNICKRDQHYRILNHMTLRDWWDERTGWSLHQMRVDSAEFAIGQVAADPYLSAEEKEKREQPWVTRLVDLNSKEDTEQEN